MSESERGIKKKKKPNVYLPVTNANLQSQLVLHGPRCEPGGGRRAAGSQGSLHSAPGREGLSSGTFCPAPVSWEAAAITFYTVLAGNPSHSLTSRKNSKGNVTLS